MRIKFWIKISFIFFIVLFFIYQYHIFTEKPISSEKYRIGVLISGTERLGKVKGLKEGLQELGFIEEMNVTYIIRNADNQLELMEQYAKELDDMDLDVIIAGGAIETKYFKENIDGKTPIVFLGAADAIHLNLVESYQKPNGRITGIENSHVELSEKRLQLFHLLLPEMKRIIVIYDENIEASLLSLQLVKEVAEDLNLPISPVSIKDKNQWEQFTSTPLEKGDGLLLLPSYYLEGISVQLGQFALENQVPIFGVNSNDVEKGFLLSYGVSYYDQGYQGAKITSQILNGTRPEDIPVEKPDTVRLLVNPETEKSLSITFSQVGNAFIHRIQTEE